MIRALGRTSERPHTGGRGALVSAPLPAVPVTRFIPAKGWSLCLALMLGACTSPPPAPQRTPAPAQSAPAESTPQDESTTEQTHPESSATQPPGYLPASESGAEVEMTEVPVGAPLQDAANQTTESQTPKGAGRDDKSGAPGGTGGAVPATGARAGASGSVSRSATSLQGAAPTPAALPPGAAHLATPAPSEAETDPAAEAARRAAFEAAMEQRRSESNRSSKGGLGGAGAATGLGSSPDITGDTSSGGPARPVGKSGLPTGTADEDVVARQLREAAQRESDPVLREKLWQEYRRYSEGG